MGCCVWSVWWSSVSSWPRLQRSLPSLVDTAGATAAAAAAVAAVPHRSAGTSPLLLSVRACASYLCTLVAQEVLAPPKPKLTVEQQVAEAEAAHRKEDAASTVSPPGSRVRS